MAKNANVVGQYKPLTNAPYGNTYNPNWRNHPNLSWKPNPPAYVPLGAKQQFGSSSQPQPSPSSSPVEQAILNLSKVVGDFVEEQKGINIQLAQRIDTVENTLNKKIDGLESSLNQRIDNLHGSCHSRVIRNQQYLYPKFPPTAVVKLQQYSGSRVERRDGFSS